MKLFTLFLLSIFFSLSLHSFENKRVVYIASDMSIPYWQIVAKGVKNRAASLNYKIDVYDTKNSAKHELELFYKALNEKVDGIILSPTDSSACVTLLNLAKKAKTPVVIADIGTDKGEYLSFISSNNKQGAYDLGKLLALKMKEKKYENGTVAIIAIPQKRVNGQDRTKGFMQALKESNIKGATIKQQVDFSTEETYLLSKEIIATHKNLRAIWLQGSHAFKGALKAIKEAKKEGEILLITFDAEPIFLDLIPKSVIVAAALQQPFLIGEESMKIFHSYFLNQNIEKNIQLSVLTISKANIKQLLPLFKRNVLEVATP